MLHMRLNICLDGYVHARVTTSAVHKMHVHVSAQYVYMLCVFSGFVHDENALWLEIELMIVSVNKKKRPERDRKKNTKKKQETASSPGGRES